MHAIYSTHKGARPVVERPLSSKPTPTGSVRQRAEHGQGTAAQGALAAVAPPETCSLSTRYTSRAPPIGRITCGTLAGILNTTPGARSSDVGLRVPFGLARIPPGVDDVLCAAIERFRQDRAARIGGHVVEHGLMFIT